MIEKRPTESGARLLIDFSGWDHTPALGSSISVNGCCLTVTSWESAARRASFDAVSQTLRVTALGDVRAGDGVNLEHALAAGALLGGHFVQGHVDGVGLVEEVRSDAADWRVRVAVPEELGAYMTPKGSVALDGVSLTLAGVSGAPAGSESSGAWIEVALIPVTLSHTTLGGWKAGHRCNIEADMLVKAVVHHLRGTGVGRS